MGEKLTVALGQFRPGASTDTNLEQIRLFTEQAVDRGAKLIVFPEYSSYFNRQIGADTVEHAQPIDGLFVETVRSIASEHNIAVVAGLDEKAPDGDKFMNTIVAVTPDGELAATYRKVHLYDAFGSAESTWALAGGTDQHPVFSFGDSTVGLQTCYDLRFPESSRVLVDAGVDVICTPAQWVPGPLKELHWTTLIQARAIENTVYVLAADHAAPAGVGRSCVVDPAGVVIGAAADEDALVVAELNMQRIAHVRKTNPALNLRRYSVRGTDW